MAEAHEFTGKSVDEAINEGLLHLHTTRDRVEIEVLNQGSRGIFGLGGELARVRLTERPAAPASAPASTVVSRTASAAGSPVAEAEQPSKPPTTDASQDNQSGIDQSEADHDEADVAQRDEIAPTPVALPAAGQTEPAPASDSTSEEELAALSTELLTEIVDLMQFIDTTVEASWQEPEDERDERYLVLNVEGEDEELNSLIGQRSETLDALQYLLRLMINQRTRQWQNIVVDVNGYKERRATQLTQLALRMADQVAASGRAHSLEPMSPSERRIVHLALREYEGVHTESSGEGERRKVHIVPSP